MESGRQYRRDNIAAVPLKNLSTLPFHEMDSPIGKLTIIASERSLEAILWDGGRELKNILRCENPVILETKRQLAEYFAGKRRSFELPIALAGTDFQLQTWRELLKIPYGSTISYEAQAKGMGNPKAMRAVGMANGKNPIPIVVPCHRVVGKNGSLTGFGGGLDKKEFLLNLEKTNRFSAAG